MSKTLGQVVDYLDQLLETKSYIDDSMNGLQVDSGNNSIEKIAVAVDCGQSIIDQAIACNADLLIVHHGLFWKSSNQVITKEFGKKIRTLIEGKCSLYANHLPLDGNVKVGNAFELARDLKLTNIEPAFELDGRTIGAKALLEQTMSFADLQQKVQDLDKNFPVLALNFGSTQIKSIGIVTGSGSRALGDCQRLSIDLLISGEAKQSSYHETKDLKLNALFAGHYNTETYGVKALLRELNKEFNLDGLFIDEPTGI